LTTRSGATVEYLGIGRDDRTALTRLVAQGLERADVLVLAGGVSAGKFDLVPEVLKELGVAAHFHKVRLKPGKPLLFGGRGDRLEAKDGLRVRPANWFGSADLRGLLAADALVSLPAGAVEYKAGDALPVLMLAPP